MCCAIECTVSLPWVHRTDQPASAALSCLAWDRGRPRRMVTIRAHFNRCAHPAPSRVEAEGKWATGAIHRRSWPEVENGNETPRFRPHCDVVYAAIGKLGPSALSTSSALKFPRNFPRSRVQNKPYLTRRRRGSVARVWEHADHPIVS